MRPTRIVYSVLAISLTAGFAPSVVSASTRAPLCEGVRATLVGTPGSDELTGTPGRDVVVALGGDDVVRTGRGRDLVCGGDGFDLAELGTGRDRALGGPGDDTLEGGRGRDALRGEGDIDSLFGGRGVDLLRAGGGTSFIVEGLIGGPGDDRLIGGPGLDMAYFFDSPRGVRVHLARGRATGLGHDELSGVEGVTGSRHDDRIVGDDTGNGLFGHGGDDVILGAGSGTIDTRTSDVISGDLGVDVLRAGPGEDLVTYARIPVGVVVDLEAGAGRGQGHDTLVGFEGVVGSAVADRLHGDAAPNWLLGLDGDDLLDGRAGQDRLDGGEGTDECLDQLDERVACEDLPPTLGSPWTIIK